MGLERSAPAVVELRERLAARNGIVGLEICAPEEVDRATRLFNRDGFVCVRDALTPEQLSFVRAGVDREARIEVKSFVFPVPRA